VWRQQGRVVLYHVSDLERWWAVRRVLTIDEVRQRAGGGGR